MQRREFLKASAIGVAITAVSVIAQDGTPTFDIVTKEREASVVSINGLVSAHIKKREDSDGYYVRMSLGRGKDQINSLGMVDPSDKSSLDDIKRHNLMALKYEGADLSELEPVADAIYKEIERLI